MIYLDLRLYPFVITACPTGQGDKRLHSFCSSSFPALLKIAPQTPPPAIKFELAAFTMASVSIFVISLCKI